MWRGNKPSNFRRVYLSFGGISQLLCTSALSILLRSNLSHMWLTAYVLSQASQNQESRTKNQEPRTKNQEPRTKNQEPSSDPESRRTGRDPKGSKHYYGHASVSPGCGSTARSRMDCLIGLMNLFTLYASNGLNSESLGTTAHMI
jgi:hypothetical protein